LIDRQIGDGVLISGFANRAEDPRGLPESDPGRRTADGPRHTSDQDRFTRLEAGGVDHGRPGGHVPKPKRSRLLGAEAIGTA
jgi:hypothetical protein